MDKLWAPWRMDYIENVDQPGCFLCDALKSTDDKKNLVLWRGGESFIIMNRYPYNSGHVMIVPNKHTANILELSAKCRDEVLELTAKMMELMKKNVRAEGFNFGMNMGHIAGAGVKDHVHFHLVPRWGGDCNFMPVIADTKSLPEYLEKTYDRLLISSF